MPKQTTPVFELADRKRWARATSKRLKHSRACRDLLAHMACRAGSGRVWNYSLADLSEDSNVSKSQVRRGVAQFVEEGLITVKRHGPMASEYTLLFSDGPVKECPLRPSRVSITAPRVSISDSDSSTKKRERNSNIPSPPPAEGIVNVLSAPLGLKAFPLKNPPETLKDTDFQEGTPSTNGKSSIPVGDLLKMGLCRRCREPLNGYFRVVCKPCWELYWQEHPNDGSGLKSLSPVVARAKGFCDTCGEQLGERDVRQTCKACMNETSPYMQRLRKGK